MPFAFYKEGKPPHPPISLSIFLRVEEALCAAWELLRTKPRVGFNLKTAAEDIITHELYETLYDRVFDKGLIEGFDRQLFTIGTRESKVRNYNRANLDKM